MNFDALLEQITKTTALLNEAKREIELQNSVIEKKASDLKKDAIALEEQRQLFENDKVLLTKEREAVRTKGNELAEKEKRINLKAQKIQQMLSE
jgi:hypothetical protein